MQHAKLSPSGSSRWLQCPASVNYVEEQKDNPIADRGTAIHHLGEHILRDNVNYEVSAMVDVDLGDVIRTFVIESDMLLEGRAYAQYCKNIKGQMEVEKRVDLTILQNNTFGHCDCVIFDSSTLHIIDLKTGRVAVSAKKNTQLMLYAYGVMCELENDFYDVPNIELHIVQDNDMCGNNTNSWTISNSELCAWIDEVVKPAIIEINSPNPSHNPSDKACLWCPNKDNCKALNTLIVDSFDKDYDMLTHADLVNIIKLEKVIKSTIESYKSKLTSELIAGTKIEGLKLIKSTPRKKWENEEVALKKMCSWLSKSEVTKQVLKTPTQCAKLLGTDISARKKATLISLIDYGTVTAKLAFDNDRGEDYDINKEFNDN